MLLKICSDGLVGGENLNGRFYIDDVSARFHAKIEGAREVPAERSRPASPIDAMHPLMHDGECPSATILG